MAMRETVKTNMKQTIRKSQNAGSTEAVKFSLFAPEAKQVSISGTFNDWNPISMPMKKGKDGTWKVTVKMSPGKYEYKYFVDGSWVHDSSCPECVMNSFGSYNNFIGVGSAAKKA